MAETSSIEWTDATWNVVTGCQVVSPGCTNCYAMRLAGGRLQNIPSRVGLTQPNKAGPVWTGEVRFNREWLTQPLTWKRPRKVFVCAHGDLFADGVEDAWLDQIFAVMGMTPQHTYQVLTKRPERMRDYCRTLGRHHESDRVSLAAKALRPDGQGFWWTLKNGGAHLPNVWLGVSAEDQRRADERIPVLLDTPAAVRFVSLEPLLGPIDLTAIQAPRHCPADHELDWKFSALDTGDYYELRDDLGYAHGSEGPDRPHRLDWVILGGESGHGARPMHPAWARQIRDACSNAGVPFFFKQWGVWAPVELWSPNLKVRQLAIKLDGGHVPDDVAPQHIGGQRFTLTTKKAAGRLLDGVEHNWMPGAGIV